MNYRIRTVPISASGQLCLFLILALTILLSAGAASAQTTGFTYQGRLTDGGTPANGNYDLQFALWDSQDGGTQIGSTQTISNVLVSAGIFTVQLDFGANAFSGASRFLEISARLSGAASFTLLAPRQQITSTPYAVRSLNATTADTATNTTQLGGVAAANYVQTSDSRLSDPRPPTPGSSNYIQNTTSQQSSSNFNISGNGTAGGTLSGNVVNATTQYNLNGNRAFAITGAGSNPATNTFAGVLAGAATTPGTPGLDGHLNSFFGFRAGFSNTTGEGNSSFGVNAGQSNTTGILNSFFGGGAGFSNTTENNNTFLGAESNGAAGITNATAIGFKAQVTQSNSLVLGSINGVNFATADTNVGIGTTAPSSVLHVVGSKPPSVSSGNGTNAAPVLQVIGGNGGDTNDSIGNGGAGASVTTQAGTGGFSPNRTGGAGGSVLIQAGNGGPGDRGGNGGSITLQAGDGGSGAGTGTGGSITLQGGANLGSGFCCLPITLQARGGNVGIGTTAPKNILHLNGNSSNFALTFTNSSNSSGHQGYRIAFDSDRLSFQRADDSGNFAANQMAIDQATGNVGIGTTAPVYKLQIVDPSNTGLRVQTNTSGGTVASFGGNGAFQIDAPGFSGGRLNILENGRVGINIPAGGNINNTLDVNGTIAVWALGSSGSTQLCWNGGTFQISNCSSSLRYKTNISRFTSGLSLVNQLKPITFNWKQGGTKDLGLGAEDLGLGAEDVAKIEPLLVTYNQKGEIEGVKYDRLTMVLLNAVKEQQEQIAALQATNAALSVRLQTVERTLSKKSGPARRRR